MNRSLLMRWYAGGYMLLAWATLVGQFVLMVAAREVSLGLTILRFFSYFTILSNLLAAIAFTRLFLRGSAALTASTLYMSVVGIIYNTVLRSTWTPQGQQLLVNESLHVVLPVVCLLGWLLLAPKADLRWGKVWGWLWFPFFYVLLCLIEGALTGWYPYPFADAAALGYPRALLNGLVILVGFLLLGLLFVAVSRMVTKGKIPQD